MATSAPSITRTARLLALMKQGDDAFNTRDVAAMDAVHHPDMIAHVTGSAEPIYGRAAHAQAMQQMFAISRTSTSRTTPTPPSSVPATGSP